MQELIEKAKKDIQERKEYVVKGYIKGLLMEIEGYKKSELRVLRELQEIGDLELDEAYGKVWDASQRQFQAMLESQKAVRPNTTDIKL